MTMAAGDGLVRRNPCRIKVLAAGQEIPRWGGVCLGPAKGATKSRSGTQRARRKGRFLDSYPEAGQHRF